MKVKKIGEEQNPENIPKPEVADKKEISQSVYVEKSNFRNGKIYFIIGGVLIIIIASLLYYFLVNQKSDNKITEENNTQSELKKKELELKEKELLLKEKELNQNNTIQKSTDKNEYSSTPGRFPEASLRYLTSDELNTLSKYDLKIMRNEIFARYGYIFQTEDMRDYFNRQSWYTPRYNDVNFFLTKIEKKNIDLIKYFEK